jgi:crotonobetainyl-CoA:carnitine CoA-transferase CaiB-like acyl-CoA transferase
MWAAIGIFAALNGRTATGEGCTVDKSLYETALGWMTMHTANYQASKRVPRRIGSKNAGIAPYKAFEASDGWIVIAAGNDNLFARLASALGRTQWSTEARFSTNPERVKNRETLNALIAEVIKSQPRDVWITKLDAAGVPCAPMLALDEILAHPQIQAVGMLQDAPDGSMRLLGLPLQFDGERPPYRSSPPKLGEANAMISSFTARAEQ